MKKNIVLKIVLSFFLFTLPRHFIYSANQNQSPFAKKVFLFTGFPGSGKGTQGKIISERLGLVHLSTGELYRAEVKTGSEVGLKMNEYMERGEIIPKELTFGYLRKELKKDKYQRGIILDGYPKNEESRVFILETFKELGYEVLGVIYFDVSREIVTKRLCGRLLCTACESNYHSVFLPPKEDNICDNCQGPLKSRSDDTEAAIAKRLDSFEEKTASLLEFFKEKKQLFPVDASADVKDVTKEIIKLIVKLTKGIKEVSHDEL